MWSWVKCLNFGKERKFELRLSADAFGWMDEMDG